VDVLLVVLVIFILTSNASIPGIKVDLPKASSSVALEKPKTKAISIDNDGRVFLDAYPVTLPELEERLRTEKALSPDFPVIVRETRRCSTPKWSKYWICCVALT
jgi:biopolymer transport protein ExbD